MVPHGGFAVVQDDAFRIRRGATCFGEEVIVSILTVDMSIDIHKA